MYCWCMLRLSDLVRLGSHINQHADPRHWLHAAMASCTSMYGLEDAYGQHEIATLSKSATFGQYNHG